MDKSRAKHEKELKRKAKKQAAAKATSGDPWKNVPIDESQFTCVAGGSFEEFGQISIHALRRLPDGQHVIANFLVDGGVVGLKDAFGYPFSSRAEFQKLLDTSRAKGVELRTVRLAEVLALVAAGARYATEYGFKLPKDWLRWSSLLGDVGDWRHTADTSAFRPEYAETIGYARRLVGTTPEAFFARPDIQFLIPDDEPLPPDPDAEDGLTGDIIHPTAMEDWVEPTRGEYADVFRVCEKRRVAAVASCTADMAEMGFEPGDHFEDDAVATYAAALAIATFGRPPEEWVKGGLDNVASDLCYFYCRIQDEVLERPDLSADTMNVLLASCAALSKRQTGL